MAVWIYILAPLTMNLENIDIELFIIIPVAIILLFLIISGIKTLSNIKQVNRMKEFIKTEKLETTATTKAYYSAIGLKKEYPSYPSKFIFSASSDEIFVYGYSKFPFIFKTYYQPFILSTDIKKTQIKLKMNRIFEPKFMNIKNDNHISIRFTDNILMATSVDYEIDFDNKLTETTLNKLKSIQKKIKN